MHRRRCAVRDHGREPLAHAIGKRLIDLRAAERAERPDEKKRDE
jgi:hypothetical protein